MSGLNPVTQDQSPFLLPRINKGVVKRLPRGRRMAMCMSRNVLLMISRKSPLPCLSHETIEHMGEQFAWEQIHRRLAAGELSGEALAGASRR